MKVNQQNRTENKDGFVPYTTEEKYELALRKLRSILWNHRGKDNAITSAAIADMLGIHEDATHALTRSLITQAIEKYRLPVAATVKGYYIIASKEEADEYITNLTSRISGILKRRETFEKNCAVWNYAQDWYKNYLKNS